MTNIRTVVHHAAALMLACALPACAGDAWREARPSMAPGAHPAFPAGAHVLRELAYGDHSQQRLDLYIPHASGRAPLIFLVHGGSWAKGDKDHFGLIDDKAWHWLPKGYALASSNYPLVPDASPLEQARDIARAVAMVQRNAASWGIDSERVVLMGHSAGAHLVALLAASPGLLVEAGATPVRGAILLDSAAYDVAHIMSGPHPALYDRAFGKDPASWREASPYDRLSRTAVPMLLVCSTGHVKAACAQAQKFADKAATLGVRTEVLPQALSHMQINLQLGQPSTYTQRVDAFLDDVLR